ncbi:1-aminocyclopropane-1-carboxylate deaminase/D-cysteine desulfhydrase [Neptunicella marina]|uniref:Pyridoxal-phosphate dependent enzyme n=1 Tax=Neptunicella marina TaxID=2125989 RepID=A0A8J6IRL3_9ALTE|nr:pyridoxal-phosphate dependent enzyme [Neptunicella marina]MBC3765124.1 pyridoxal-phosphate dependent enzyme [Neptunicella marina]
MLEKFLQIQSPSPEHSFQPDWHNPADCRIWIKRDDLLHPVISGNKWRKLKFALNDIQRQNVDHIISFGGGYSNHLHALGYCCHQLNIKLTAIVRGHYPVLTPMLRDLNNWGTQIEFVDKKNYQQRNDDEFLQSLNKRFPGAVIIPEGGSQHQALAGITECVNEFNRQYDYILLPVASGATMAGIINASPAGKSQVTGIAVLKGQDYLESLVNRFVDNNKQTNWQINHQYHFGGYSKSPAELQDFCQQITNKYNIPIEPVYSGKLFFALKSMLEQQSFGHKANILVLHTGGIQGSR